MASPEQEAMARKAGFPNYAQMRAFYLARQNNDGKNTIAIQGSTPPPAQQGQPVLPSNAMSWHPAVILQGISDFFGKLNK